MPVKPKKSKNEPLTPSEYEAKRYNAEILTLGEIDGKRFTLIATNEPIDVEDLQKRFEGKYEIQLKPIDPKDKETIAQLFVLAQYLDQQKKKKGDKSR